MRDLLLSSYLILIFRKRESECVRERGKKSKRKREREKKRRFLTPIGFRIKKKKKNGKIK